MNNRLNTQDLARLLSEQTGKDREMIERFLREFISVVSEGVYTDKVVKVKGLGVFKILLVEKRESIHVNTGERFLIPAHYKFSFLPDKELREQVNKPFSFFETTEINENVIFSDIDVSEEEKDTEDESVEEVLPDHEIPIIDTIVEIEPAQSVDIPLEDQPASELEPKIEPNPIPEPDVILEKPASGKPGHKGVYLGILGVIIVLVSSVIIYIGKERWLKSPSRQTVVQAKDTVRDLSEVQDTIMVVNEPVPTPKPTIVDTVKINSGDRLTVIALKYYGNKLFWVYLYQHNKERIKDPNSVPIGTVIEIPAPELYGIDANSRESRDKAAALQTEILTRK